MKAALNSTELNKTLVSSKAFNLPVFVLPVFLLPQGITRIRIFEPRYLKMVSIAMQEQGFIIATNPEISTHAESKTNAGLENWGSWVEIVNFDKGADGVLEIDVKSKHLVKMTSIVKDKNNLPFADVVLAPHWSEQPQLNDMDTLAPLLDQHFKKDALLQNLYLEKAMNNSCWVLARWLELLPLPLDIKANFLAQHSYENAKNFVRSIILK